jgi:hypothetical protein
MRPLAFLDNPEHLLTIHQRDGMALAEAITQAREIGALLVTS